MRELEVGDDVTDDTIEAYNTLIHGPRHVKHQGRPRDGDKVGSILGRGHLVIIMICIYRACELVFEGSPNSRCSSQGTLLGLLLDDGLIEGKCLE